MELLDIAIHEASNIIYYMGLIMFIVAIIALFYVMSDTARSMIVGMIIGCVSIAAFIELGFMNYFANIGIVIGFCAMISLFVMWDELKEKF